MVDLLHSTGGLQAAVYINAVGLGFLIVKELVKNFFAGAKSRREEEKKKREKDEQWRDQISRDVTGLSKNVSDMQCAVALLKAQSDTIRDFLFKSGPNLKTDP